MFAMRVFVLLLAFPSLLMPPGMCVCRFAGGGPTAAGEALYGQTLLGTERTACHTGCCRKAHQEDVEPLAGDDHSDPLDTDGGQPPPEKHAPGCPVLQTVGNSRITTPPTTVALDLSTSLPRCLCQDGAPPASAETRLAVEFVPDSTPVYISLCTLRI
jgi:hypothetical protein